MEHSIRIQRFGSGDLWGGRDEKSCGEHNLDVPKARVCDWQSITTKYGSTYANIDVAAFRARCACEKVRSYWTFRRLRNGMCRWFPARRPWSRSHVWCHALVSKALMSHMPRSDATFWCQKLWCHAMSGLVTRFRATVAYHHEDVLKIHSLDVNYNFYNIFVAPFPLPSLRWSLSRVFVREIFRREFRNLARFFSEVVKNLLEIEESIPWETLLFVVGHINYGGRVGNWQGILVGSIGKFDEAKTDNTICFTERPLLMQR